MRKKGYFEVEKMILFLGQPICFQIVCREKVEWPSFLVTRKRVNKELSWRKPIYNICPNFIWLWHLICIYWFPVVIKCQTHFHQLNISLDRVAQGRCFCCCSYITNAWVCQSYITGSIPKYLVIIYADLENTKTQIKV